MSHVSLQDDLCGHIELSDPHRSSGHSNGLRVIGLWFLCLEGYFTAHKKTNVMSVILF